MVFVSVLRPTQPGWEKRTCIFPYWIYTNPFIYKLRIPSNQLDKELNLEPPKLCMYKPTKNIAAEIAPNLSSALRDL